MSYTRLVPAEVHEGSKASEWEHRERRCWVPRRGIVIIFHTYVRVVMGTRDKENSPFKLKVICSGIDLYNIYSYSLSFSTNYSSLLPLTKPAHHRNQPAYNPSPSIRFTLTPLPHYPIPLREISSSTKKKRKREKSKEMSSPAVAAPPAAQPLSVRPTNLAQTRQFAWFVG